jgi:hypothetical protein
MNFPVGIVDEEGIIHRLVINEKFLVELNERLRTDGITAVHTYGENGQRKTYNAQAVIQMAKGCKGSMMFIPHND